MEGVAKVLLLVLRNKRIIADIAPMETAEIGVGTRGKEKMELF
jgi:hypothetical protein